MSSGKKPVSLSYGLNTTKPKKPTGPPKPKRPLAAFAPADDGSGDDGEEAAAAVFSGGKGGPAKAKNGKDRTRVNAQLATFSGLSKKAEENAAKAAAEVDPSIFDYDGAWEDMKSVDRKKKLDDEQDAIERKPKYMENLLAAAEVRKRDQLRAKEKLLQREREAEGDEFKDKESFVTGAYKKQQEEMRLLEEEERLREEKLKSKSQGMSTFYRNMLDKTESKHDVVVAASKDHKGPPIAAEEPPEEKGKSEAEIARELKEKGAAIDINEEGEVVDKTQLLSGGLNVSTKKSRASEKPAAMGSRPQQAYQGRSKTHQDMRARQTKMIEEQLAQAQKRAYEEEDKTRQELERQAKSRKTETDVLGAKERYLQRKREAEAAKAKGK